MKFKLEIACDNAAFDNESRFEVARILHAVANRVEDGQREGSLHDVNGNRVGEWRLVP